MKVRWTKSSIRLRVTPEELERLRRGDAVGEGLFVVVADVAGVGLCG